MKFNFTDIPAADKANYIRITAETLIDKLDLAFGVPLDIEKMKTNLADLVKFKNLRDIKRKIEDIVFIEFFRNYKQ
jgi:ATP-dependent Clp protease ATP-binding subunit ClpC